MIEILHGATLWPESHFPESYNLVEIGLYQKFMRKIRPAEMHLMICFCGVPPLASVPVFYVAKSDRGFVVHITRLAPRGNGQPRPMSECPLFPQGPFLKDLQASYLDKLARVCGATLTTSKRPRASSRRRSFDGTGKSCPMCRGPIRPSQNARVSRLGVKV